MPTTKLLLSTLTTAALMFGAPAYSADEKAHADDKAHVHCDLAKDKNCKDEHPAKGDEHGHKAGEKHEHKEGDGHAEKDGHDHSKDEKKK